MKHYRFGEKSLVRTSQYGNNLGQEYIVKTNSKGRIFISYRRLEHRIAEAVLVRDTLRDRGIPTWRDLDNLESKPTEEQLIQILNDQNTSGAIMLIAKEVRDSTMIRNVEAPRIFNRFNKKDGFIVKPVLTGIGYQEANDILNAPAGFQDLGNWNLHKLGNDSVTLEDARMVANDVLKARLNEVSNQYSDEAIDLRIYTRSVSNPDLNTLVHDFSNYFNGREPVSGAFEKIEFALKDTARAISLTRGEANISAGGFASLPTGVLFGAIFSPLRKFKVSWAQSLVGHDEIDWSLCMKPSPMELDIKKCLGDTSSIDVVLALGISANIEHAVTDYLNANVINPRCSIYVQLPIGPLKQGVSLTPAEGLSIALQSVDAVRFAKDDLMLNRINLHLFLACPLALAVLLGQKLNTVSTCFLYEHTPTGEQNYDKVHTFSPSDISY